jgi:hypothetical protein
MTHGGEFEYDAFISYARIDNEEPAPGYKGWVTELHRGLEFRLAQLLGRKVRIWRDPTIHENDDFAQLIVDRLAKAAALVSVVSPRYVKSEWTRRELTEFCRAAEEQGGVCIGEKARVLPVLKTPVPREEHPPELRPYTGYKFYKIDPDTGHAREFSRLFGKKAELAFWTKLMDVADDLRTILVLLGADEPPDAEPSLGEPVYLAVTSSDLSDQREVIRRELEQHGHTVLPNRPLPTTAADVEDAVRDDLARCRLSIHLIGRTYSMVPEGGLKSLIEIQNDLAIERAAQGGREGSFTRLLWIPMGLTVDDERQREFVEHLRTDPRIPRGTDLLETPLEDLKTLLATRLGDEGTPRRGDAVPDAVQQGAPQEGAPQQSAPQLYLIFDKRDAAAAAPWAEMLFAQQVEVLNSVFDGDEAQIREYHRENLRSCDGALILHGSADEIWLRSKMRELQKSAGYGRTKPLRAVGICLIPPRTPEKERFRTHHAMVIPQWDGVSAEPLQPFLSRLHEETEAGELDALVTGL